MDGAVKGWPRVERKEQRLACDFCDCLHQHEPLAERESAHCLNCGETLYENRPRSLQRAISFSLSAFFLMLIVLFFPFISINARGLGASMTVWTCLQNLWLDGAPVLAFATGAVVVVLPMLMIFMLLRTTIPLLFERAGWGAIRTFRAVLWMERWVMVEVFFLGTVVSLVKILSLAEVKLGVGFWAFAGVMIFLAAAMGSLDKFEFWDRIESAREREREDVE